MSLNKIQKLFAEKELRHLNIKVMVVEQDLPIWKDQLLDLQIKIRDSPRFLVYIPIVGYQIQYNKLKGLVDMNEKYLPEWKKKIAHLQAVLRDEIEPMRHKLIQEFESNSVKVIVGLWAVIFSTGVIYYPLQDYTSLEQQELYPISLGLGIIVAGFIMYYLIKLHRMIKFS